jgi:hypothetical protein
MEKIKQFKKMGEGVVVNVVMSIITILMGLSLYGAYLNSFVEFVPGSTFENASLFMHCFIEVFHGYPYTSCKCVVNPPSICKNTTHFIGAEIIIDVLNCALSK